MRRLEESDLMSGAEVRKLLGGISPRTLDRYRSKYWHCGIHYVQPTQRCQYVRPMILDWLVNRQEPAAHQNAMEAWLAANQAPKQRKRAS
ncbi:MAG: hypothetical protein HC860_16285 [Alkalinema sp. RU_4_3]|nr:hypothetical protein [Alkalinema sp. RU_4_3]